MFRTAVVSCVVVVCAVCVSCSSVPLPKWTAQRPDPSQPLGGFKQAAAVRNTRVYKATEELGAYNHACMMTYTDGRLVLSWKNSPLNEDSAGQRVLYATSADGTSWTPTDGTNIMFPNCSTDANPVHLFASPFLHLNGRVYAAASPIQFCLFPDQYMRVLLSREVFSNNTLGPVFWANGAVPSGYGPTSATNHIRVLGDMPAYVQQDFATLAHTDKLPCSTNGTLKCEACVNNCQNWTSVPVVDLIANERTHFTVPGTADVDVLLYRSHSKALWASSRPAPNAAWTAPALTNIPDDDSNINAGRLPDGRVYLVSNANAGYQFRDPLTVATTKGVDFSSVQAMLSCTQLGFPDQPDGCSMRIRGHAKSAGPAYPQAVTVVDSDSAVPDGLYTCVSNNKEDIWVSFVPFSSI